MHRSEEEARMENDEQGGSSASDWFEQRVFAMGNRFVDPFAAQDRAEVQGWSPRSALRSAGRGLKKGVQATGRGIKKGAQVSAKYGVKYGQKGAMLATAPGRLMLNASAWAVFAPVRLICNKVIDRYVSEFKKHGQTVTKLQGRAWLYGKLAKSRNPVLKASVFVLKQYGPGTSPKVRIMGDESSIGAGEEVVALQAALAASYPALVNMAIAAATAAALAAAKKAVDRATGGEGGGGAPINVVPSDAAVDNALEPQSDGMQGWEAGCCA